MTIMQKRNRSPDPTRTAIDRKGNGPVMAGVSNVSTITIGAAKRVDRIETIASVLDVTTEIMVTIATISRLVQIVQALVDGGNDGIGFVCVGCTHS